MNEKENKKVSVLELKNLSRDTHLTARLDTGEIIILCPEYCIQRKTGYIKGKKIPVDVLVFYSEIFSKIRTIKNGMDLVARRTKTKKQSILEWVAKRKR